MRALRPDYPAPPGLDSAGNASSTYRACTFGHSTRVAGYAVVYGGGDRWVGNVFCGSGGTALYDGHPASFQEYLDARIRTW